MPHRAFDTMLQTQTTSIAIAGASHNPMKYGHIATKFLAAQGYTVWPLHTECSDILGLRTYPHLNALPSTPDILCTVTAPRETRQLVCDAALANCSYLWLQPGSFNALVLRQAAMSGMYIEAQRCILVASAQWLGEPTEQRVAGLA